MHKGYIVILKKDLSSELIDAMDIWFNSLNAKEGELLKIRSRIDCQLPTLPSSLHEHYAAHRRAYVVDVHDGPLVEIIRARPEVSEIDPEALFLEN